MKQWRIVESAVGYIKIMDWRNGEPQKGKTRKCTICTLYYRELEDGSFEWEFMPWWDRLINISDNWKPVVHNGWIPGLDEDDFDDPMRKKRETYIFKNRKPPFVYQRTPPRNRGDVMKRMYSVGLEEYDAMEYMIRTPFRCGNDYFIVEDDTKDDY